MEELSMAEATSTNSEQHEFKAEIQRVLNILIHSLYQHREIFLRELISNASDALNKMRFILLTDRNVRDPEVELSVKLEIDTAKNTITIRDTGIGLTRDELIKNIGTIASSGSHDFLEKLKEQAGDKKEGQIDLDIIGKFGVGFYSVFMVSREVHINTRSYL